MTERLKKLFAIIASLVGIGILIILLKPQFSSMQEMGTRRYEELSRPSNEVVVGVCWPFSAFRSGFDDGLNLALEEINAGNLAGGYRIRLVMRDDEFDKDKAKRIAMEFADNPQMSAVIGYYDDSFGIAASPIFEASRLFHIITGANSTQMTSYGFNYIARTILSSDKIAAQLAKFTIDHGYRKVAIIMEEDAFGEELAYQYQSCLEKYDVKPVYFWPYAREMVDFTLPANQLKGADADLIFFSGLDAAAGPFINKVRRVGLNTPILGAFGDAPDILQQGGGARLDKSMYYDIYDVNSNTPENSAFVRKFYTRYGRKPTSWAAQGYDALHLLAKALKTTGSRNSLDLSYAVRYMDAWNGANGRYKFDRSGNIEDKPIYIFRFNGRQPVLMP
jgi:branched-chain amino acid transport system substrate-binding protein